MYRLTPIPTKETITLAAPPSKSMAIRMLICAAVSKTPCKILLSSVCEDVKATMDCLRALGAKVFREGNYVYIDGSFIKPSKEAGTFECRESGTTARFFMALAAVYFPAYEIIVSGTLRNRPMDTLQTCLEAHGLIATRHEESDTVSFAMLGTLQPGEYTLPADVSSQYVSALLLTLPQLPSFSVLHLTQTVVSHPYIEMTLDVLKLFGIKIIKTSDGFEIPGDQTFTLPKDPLCVEGDWSNAALLLFYALKYPNVTVSNLKLDSSQAEVPAFVRMGVLFSEEGEALVPYLAQTDYSDDVSLSDAPDLLPVMVAYYASIHHPLKLDSVARLRTKESDRIQAMLSFCEAIKADACYTDEANGTFQLISGYSKKERYEIKTYSDHRILMAAVLFCLLTGQEVYVDNLRCMDKSFPDLFDTLKDFLKVSEE